MSLNFSGDLGSSTTNSMIDFKNFSVWNDSYPEMLADGDNRTTFDRSTMYKTWSPPPLTTAGYIVIPIYILIFCVAVIGNVLVILTLIQNKRMRTVTNVLLLNLSLSDLLLAVFCMPFTVIPMLLKNFIFGEPLCIMIRYFQGKWLQFYFSDSHCLKFTLYISMHSLFRIFKPHLIKNILLLNDP